MIDIQFLTQFLIGGLTGCTIMGGYHLARMSEAQRKMRVMRSAIDGFVKKLEAQRELISEDLEERWQLKQEKIEQDAMGDD